MQSLASVFLYLIWGVPVVYSCTWCILKEFISSHWTQIVRRSKNHAQYKTQYFTQTVYFESLCLSTAVTLLRSASMT